MDHNCFLVLQDGTTYSGISFGYEPLSVDGLSEGTLYQKGAGEVIFNTAMSGYHEIFTDPSYTGQLVVMTYPHIGNYGTDDTWSENGPEPDKRASVKAAGCIVRSLSRGSVPSGRKTLHDYLREQKTPGITDIDTRALTLKIRDEGNPLGIIVSSSRGESRAGSDELAPGEIDACTRFLDAFPPMVGRKLVGEVGTTEITGINTSGTGPHVALYDSGIKANIIRELSRLDCRITLLPHLSTAEEILAAGPDAVLLSNGPGDPAVLDHAIEMTKQLIGKVPLFGICLGHQIISLALGAETYKMRFGHHGANHPVRDEITGKVCVTSQNHGFSVQEQSLPGNVSVWMRNANDGSVEGIYHHELPVLSVQFHPEAAPGPRDSLWIFKRFLQEIDGT